MEFKTVQDALKHYDLDFDIEIVPDYFFNKITNAHEEIPFRYVVVRKDIQYPLGNVGERYTLAPLSLVLGTLQPFIDDGSLAVSKFYVENRGAKVSCCFKLNNCYTEFGGFLVDSEFSLKLSHDGSSKGIVSILARAQNGNIYPFGNEYSLSFKHTKGSIIKINKLESVLSAVKKEWKDFEEYMQLGSVESISDDEAKTYLENYMKLTTETPQGENALEAIFKRWHNVIIPQMRNTIFGLYISVCDWAQEERAVRVTSKRRKQAGLALVDVNEIRILNLLKNRDIYTAWAGLKAVTNMSAISLSMKQ